MLARVAERWIMCTCGFDLVPRPSAARMIGRIDFVVEVADVAHDRAPLEGVRSMAASSHTVAVARAR